MFIMRHAHMVMCLVYITICYLSTLELETVSLPCRISYLYLKECLAPQAKNTLSSTTQTATKEQDCQIWK